MLSEADIVYIKSLGFTGAAPDLFYSFLKDKGISEGATPDMLYAWLKDMSSTGDGAVQDMMEEALVGSGYTLATLPSDISFYELISSIFLTDEAGNVLTDAAGNRLTAE